MKNIENNDYLVLDYPDFENAKKAHDWRNYVSVELRKSWKTFTLKERRIIYTLANKIALSEEWD